MHGRPAWLPSLAARRISRCDFGGRSDDQGSGADKGLGRRWGTGGGTYVGRRSEGGGSIKASIIKALGAGKGVEALFLFGKQLTGCPSLVTQTFGFPDLSVVSQMGSETRRYIHTREASMASMRRRNTAENSPHG